MSTNLKDLNKSMNLNNDSQLEQTEPNTCKDYSVYVQPNQNKENNKINDINKNSAKNRNNLKKKANQPRKSSCNLKYSYDIQKFDPNISKHNENNAVLKKNNKVTFCNNENTAKVDKKNENNIRGKIKEKSAKPKHRRLSSDDNIEKIFVKQSTGKRMSNFVGFNNTNKKTNVTKSL